MAAAPIAVTPLGPYGATDSAPGHWLTCAVHGVHCLALGDTGRFIQVLLVDQSTGISLATAVVRVDYGHPSDAHGRFFEAIWMGADQPTVDAAWAPMMGTAQQPVYHICVAPRPTCQVTWPGRNVLHLDTLRERALPELEETWIRLPPGVGRPLLPLQANPAVHCPELSPFLAWPLLVARGPLLRWAKQATQVPRHPRLPKLARQRLRKSRS